MTVKINSLEVENVKRVKAVALEPAESGLTVIGGRNGQGKTSVLDAIAWALGGDRKRPSEAKRAGSATDPHLKVQLSNGIVVERRGKAGSLKVTDPEGRKGGQQLLDSFVESLALDLPKFLAMSDKDKAKTLLGIIGVQASFLVFEMNGGVSISARSMGQLNVQIIMEKLGGGGHLTMAGAQLSGMPLDEAYRRLVAAIDQYFEENSRN